MPEFPTESLEKSTQGWLARNGQKKKGPQQGQEYGAAAPAAGGTERLALFNNPVPRIYPCLRVVHDLDIIFTVEHCHNCQAHRCVMWDVQSISLNCIQKHSIAFDSFDSSIHSNFLFSFVLNANVFFGLGSELSLHPFINQSINQSIESLYHI